MVRWLATTGCMVQEAVQGARAACHTRCCSSARNCGCAACRRSSKSSASVTSAASAARTKLSRSRKLATSVASSAAIAPAWRLLFNDAGSQEAIATGSLQLHTRVWWYEDAQCWVELTRMRICCCSAPQPHGLRMRWIGLARRGGLCCW